MAHQTNIAVNGATVPVWEFDHTAQEIDDAVERAYSAVRPNLLDNPYFVGGGTGWGALPVNQRGQSAYTSGYGIDRWMASGTMELSLSSGGIQLTCPGGAYGYLVQYLSDTALAALRGRAFTISVLTDQGLFSVTDTFPASEALDTKNILCGENMTMDINDQAKPKLRIYNLGGNAASLAVLALKLELGEGQTLAYQTGDGTWALLPQPDGDYQTQFLRCQSYLLVLNRAKATWVTFGQGNAYSESRCFLTVPTPVPLRATPTLAVSGELCLRNGADYPAVSSVTVYRLAENAVVLDARGSGFTPGAHYDLLYANGDGGSLVLSAEL